MKHHHQQIEQVEVQTQAAAEAVAQAAHAVQGVAPGLDPVPLAPARVHGPDSAYL